MAQLNGRSGNDILVGSVRKDSFVARDGDDQLFGNGGNDTMYAGNGNDLVEGGADNDLMWGEGGNDIMRGDAGDDRLNGGVGNDSLDGGLGADQFMFDAALVASNIDTIVDFSVVDDTIVLDSSFFAAVGAPGALSTTAFHIGSAAHDADDRVIYDSVTGKLYYDANGNGAGGQVLFALLSPGLAMTAADFLVVP